MTGQLPNLVPVLPELTLAIGSMILLMFGVFRGNKSFSQVTMLSIALLVITGFVLLNQVGFERQLTFNDMFVSDSFAIFTKILILVGSGVAMLISTNYLKDHEIAKFEYPILILLATLGMMLMVSANSLLSLYMGLELQSLALYVLAAMNRDRTRSTEAGLKYFVLGALSSGMLLYGISLIYGFSGSVNFDVLAETLKGGADASLGVIIGMVFMIAGFAFKVSAVPFHMWTPDVYEGSPTPVTAFFAAAPKVAAFGLFIRVMISAFPEMQHEWQQVVIFISLASMITGAFLALVQKNIKRLMAYSSIGHIGYGLMGLAAGTEKGIEALLVYLAIYLTMTLGAFAAILTMRRADGMVEDIEDLSGLSRNNLPMAIAIATFMFSLAGIPLLAGFLGKWYVFLAAVDAGLIPLAVVGVVTSVVGAFYYLNIIKIMFFNEPADAFEPVGSRSLSAVIGVSAILNSPVGYLLIAPLTAAAAWGASSLIF